MSLPALPKVFSVPALPGLGKTGPDIGFVEIPIGRSANVTDEFGLLLDVYGTAPKQSRQYISLALEHLRLPKNISPTVLFGPGAGTIPELVTFGWLLAEGFRYQTQGPKGFFFQSWALGGRDIPGGAVVDFVVYITTGRRIGVNVDSIYHSPKNPYAPGQKLESDRRRDVRLTSQGNYDAIIYVNQRAWGYPLENGPDSLVVLDLQRLHFA